jgi:hypothetical protein
MLNLRNTTFEGSLTIVLKCYSFLSMSEM